jgi:hypothetical protein
MKQLRLPLRQAILAASTAAGAVILTGIILLALASVASAQASSNYDLSWHVIGGGIRQMGGTNHSLQTTLGQPAAGSISSDGHTLCSGFWCAGTTGFKIYLPLILRDSP